jgi:opine dehydrogenase
MSKKITWAIVGGGNGGQSVAGHLALMGYPVRLYDIFPKTVNTINEQGGVKIGGVVEGFGKLEFATLDMGKALTGADVVLVTAPATAHKAIAKECAPHLTARQIVIIHPSATCAALEFREVLRKSGCEIDIPVAETNSLIYTCRSPRPGEAEILGIKQDLVLAALPADQNSRALECFREAFPQIKAGRNVLETSLGNANAVMHPTPTILNLSMIESRHDWLYYCEGITPTIGAFVEALDEERLVLAKSFGLDLPSIREWYRLAYGVEGQSLSEVCRKNPAYEKVKGQKDLRTRYILEDIPYSLVPMIELGRMQGVPMGRMEVVAKLGQYLLKDDCFLSNGRTLKNLGVENMNPEQFVRFIQTGKRPSQSAVV